LRVQCENRQSRVLFALESEFQFSRFNNRWQLPARDHMDSAAKASRTVIAAALMLCDPPKQILCRADVISAGFALQDINPSHNQLGRPGLEPGTNALKGRCSTS
jgi:hypothetical protein